MKKFSLLFGLCAALVCSGMSQERFVSEDSSNRKALLEEFTGVNCGYCPDGHKISNQIKERLGDDFYMINVHSGGYSIPGPGQLDLRTDYGAALNSTYNPANSFPAGTMNRHIFSGSSYRLDRGSWPSAADNIVKLPSYLNVASRATLDWASRKLDVTVQIYYTGDSPQTVNFLNVALLQDNILGYQSGGATNPEQVVSDGVYCHMHALRDFLTGQWGDSIKTTQKGSFVEKTYSVTLPDTIGNVELKLADITLLAYVTETRNEVMSACEAEISHIGGPEVLFSITSAELTDHFSCDDKATASFVLNTRIVEDSITSITYVCSTDAGEQEFTYTFPEPIKKAGETIVVTEPFSLGLVNGTVKAKVQIIGVNGHDYESETECSKEMEGIKYLAVSPKEDVVLRILQDKYGTDITWTLKDQDNEVLYSGGPYRDLNSSGTKLNTETIKISDGCYVWTVYDKGSDGVNNSYGEGSLSMADDMGNVFWNHDGKYTDSLQVMLRMTGVGNEVSEQMLPVVLTPNPASQQSVLRFELPSSTVLDIRIMDVTGHSVMSLGHRTYAAGMQEVEIPVSGLSDGMYFVVVYGDGVRTIGKLVVRK